MARTIVIQKIASFLGGAIDEHGHARGKRLGAPLAVRLRHVDQGRVWVHAEVGLPSAYPLELHVRNNVETDRPSIERGLMLDLELGDAAFDARFRTEGAPADIVSRLLDAPLREVLLRFPESYLRLSTVGTDRVLELALLDGLSDELLWKGLEIMAQFPDRVREAYADAAAAAGMRQAGDAYRPAVDDRPARDAQEQREEQVADLDAMRARRAKILRRYRLALVGLLVALVIFGLLVHR